MLQPCHDKWVHIGSCFSVAVESVFPLDLLQKGTLLMLRAKREHLPYLECVSRCANVSQQFTNQQMKVTAPDVLVATQFV